MQSEVEAKIELLDKRITNLTAQTKKEVLHKHLPLPFIETASRLKIE